MLNKYMGFDFKSANLFLKLLRLGEWQLQPRARINENNCRFDAKIQTQRKILFT
ncbi:hypothetical protein FMO003_25310 [Moritella sp. F3]|nr:hypothetical protein FMO001_18580 [Moritella sp. F1]GIC82250.1 hypothetical protein FMO003_25310 [Moritella sp. F3]